MVNNKKFDFYRYMYIADIWFHNNFMGRNVRKRTIGRVSPDKVQFIRRD